MVKKPKDHSAASLRFRRELDLIPELSWREVKTRDHIVSKLGRNYHWAKKTALVYKLGAGVPVIFRAELDALSTKDGPKHVCGHSAHAAALMAAYLFLREHPVPGFAIYFIFQPSEESYPSGAEFIVKNFSALKKCRAAFGFHVFPDAVLGRLTGGDMASGDYFEIEIFGRAGHVKDKNAAETQDALVAAGELLVRINSAKTPHWIMNVGRASGGDAPNKIAGRASLAGDVRALTEEDRRAAARALKRICRETQKRTGAQVKLHYDRGYPALKNDRKLLRRVGKVLTITAGGASFATEDFSLYPVPKVFLHIGTGARVKLHADDFCVKDKVVQAIYHNWLKLAAKLPEIFI